MNKFEALIITGKLEVRLEKQVNLLEEVANLQKFIVENDYTKLAISFGRLSESIKGCEIDVSENMQFLHEFISEVEKINSDINIAKEEKKLNMTLEELNLSVRTYNCLKRANICTVKDLLALSKEDLLCVRNLGKSCIEEVISKLEKLGFKLSSN